MWQAGLLSASGAKWETGYLEDTTVRRIVLDLYDRDYQSLLRYVIFLGLQQDLAQDVTQESFLKLHEHLLGGGNQSNLRAWLYRVAHNTARNRQSVWQVSKTDSLPEKQDGFELVSASLSPEEQVLLQERERVLRRAVQTLSPAQKQCLILRSQGFKYREIAEVLQLATSTVAENVARGLEHLRTWL